MIRRLFLKSLGITGAAAVVPVHELIAAPKHQHHRTNTAVKGKVHEDGKGIAKVAISDGYTVTITDQNGNYSIDTHSKAEYVFISLPSGYVIPNDKGIARLYHSLDRTIAEQHFDFNLVKNMVNDHKHAFVVWADPQIRYNDEAKMLMTQSAPDTAALIKTMGNIPMHGIGCGDLVFDQFDLFDEYMQAVEITGIPFFQLIGNHDMDNAARTDDYSQQTFKSLFGPTYYSFNRGKIHYVVLDDVFFLGTSGQYLGYITEDQLNWLEQDLQLVPAGSTVVVSLHIPTSPDVASVLNTKVSNLGGAVSNRTHLYKLLKPFKVHIMSGHTHINKNWEHENMYEHNHGTICGAWWTGPICGDGTPNGYGVYTVNGDDISWFYKSVGQPKEYQMSMFPAGKLPEHPNAIAVNVWNWDTAWKVEWYEDGRLMGEMKQVTALDPLAVELLQGPEKPSKAKWADPGLTDHMFIAEPSAGAKELMIKVTDRFGKVYTEKITGK